MWKVKSWSISISIWYLEFNVWNDKEFGDLKNCKNVGNNLQSPDGTCRLNIHVKEMTLDTS